MIGYSPAEDIMIIFYDYLSVVREALGIYTSTRGWGQCGPWASSTHDVCRNRFTPHRMGSVDYYCPYRNHRYTEVMDILCSVQASPNVVTY